MQFHALQKLDVARESCFILLSNFAGKRNGLIRSHVDNHDRSLYPAGPPIPLTHCRAGHFQIDVDVHIGVWDFLE